MVTAAVASSIFGFSEEECEGVSLAEAEAAGALATGDCSVDEEAGDTLIRAAMPAAVGSNMSELRLLSFLRAGNPLRTCVPRKAA
jgi:hypothetical protein